MKWTAQQETALKKLADFIRHPDQLLFRLWGEAGTGKTTLAAEIRDRFDHLAFIALAYTGKAASRLRQKGWKNAGTIHSHLYIPGSKCRARITEMESRREQIRLELADEEQPPEPETRAALNAEDEDLAIKIAAEEEALKSPMFILNTETDLTDYKVIVLDEVSMVGKEGHDLDKLCREHRIKLILMGDPYQLPPVKSTAHFMTAKPDYQLTDVQRQAKDDPILWLAHKARAREPIPLGSYGQSKVVTRMKDPYGSDAFHTDQLVEMITCDQLLCGTNNTRMYCNYVMREARGYKGLLEVGEKLVCLANSKQGFFNGSVWYCQDILGEDKDRDRLVVSLSSDDPMEEDRIAKIHCRSLKGLDVHFTERSGAECMVSAQALTVHKFQGSEGRHIMILDESYTAREDAHRWLYTAITRAQERLTLVTKG